MEKNLPREVLANAALARLRTLGRRSGSTCFSRAGIAGFSSIRAGAGNLAASAAFSAQARDGFAEVADRVAGLVLLGAQHFDVALEFRDLRMQFGDGPAGLLGFGFGLTGPRPRRAGFLAERGADSLHFTLRLDADLAGDLLIVAAFFAGVQGKE